ncbi:MAG: hypothetical protein HWD57_11595 [Candidatus Accumulibacter cognatus]|uniref:Uncharacterized protein n=1 Tax=Candidatus Accumulibacter cognatus TaxID=2954383 RepID=A0A080MCT6_9PROT|nr:MAG: hypothetical protein AW06_004001 [Candidatus Accumulibacter cognatus]QLH50357.1 MAG: hypothetical protein HWD57_11595 [Candidatus Accumulibacter cognatus]
MVLVEFGQTLIAAPLEPVLDVERLLPGQKALWASRREASSNRETPFGIRPSRPWAQSVSTPLNRLDVALLSYGISALKSADHIQHLQGKLSAYLVRYASDFVVMLNGIPLRLHRLSLPGR